MSRPFYSPMVCYECGEPICDHVCSFCSKMLCGDTCKTPHEDRCDPKNRCASCQAYEDPPYTTLRRCTCGKVLYCSDTCKRDYYSQHYRSCTLSSTPTPTPTPREAKVKERDTREVIWIA